MEGILKLVERERAGEAVDRALLASVVRAHAGRTFQRARLRPCPAATPPSTTAGTAARAPRPAPRAAHICAVT